MSEKEKILVAISKSESRDLTLKHVVRWANQFDLEIILLTVLDDVVHYKKIPDSPLYEMRKKEAEVILEKAQNELELQGVACRIRIGIGPVAEQIIRIAKEENVFAIMLGVIKKSKLDKLIMGSTAQFVILKADCPVVAVK